MAGKDQGDRFRKTLWPKIEDAVSALEALRLAQWVGLLIAIGYGFAIAIAIAYDRYPDGTAFEDENELYGIVFIYLVLIAVALLFWFLVRRAIGWAALVVSVWGLVEAALKLVGGGGIILTILLILFCLSGIRGWLGGRKFGRPGGGAGAADAPG